MKQRGSVWKFGDDIDTDAIIPAKHLNIDDPDELSKHCMEGVCPDFSKKTAKGDIIAAGKNFGFGSSREHAPIAIKAAGIFCVIAISFARIFYRNAFNIGLPILECDDASKINEKEILSIDLDEGKIINETASEIYWTKPIPGFMQEILKSGGIMKYIMHSR